MKLWFSSEYRLISIQLPRFENMPPFDLELKCRKLKEIVSINILSKSTNYWLVYKMTMFFSFQNIGVINQCEKLIPRMRESNCKRTSIQVCENDPIRQNKLVETKCENIDILNTQDTRWILSCSGLLYWSLCRTIREMKMQQSILHGTHIQEIEVREFTKASLSPSNLHHSWSKISGAWVEDIKLCYLLNMQLLEVR